MICLSNSSVLWGFSSSFFFLIFFWYIHSKFFVREFLPNICSQWAYSCDQSDQLPDGPHHTHGGCKNRRLAQRPVEVNNSEAAKEQPTKPRTWNIATLTPKAGLKQVHNRWWAGGIKKSVMRKHEAALWIEMSRSATVTYCFLQSLAPRNIYCVKQREAHELSVG